MPVYLTVMYMWGLYLQAVNVQAVQFRLVRLLQDPTLLHCCQMLLQVIFNLTKALKEYRNYKCS